jgi:hypothetical protein
MAKRIRELIETVKNDQGACVDRGEAIVELKKSGMNQRQIASSTKLSAVAISHLKKCFLNLEGKAREKCKDGTMNGDACYSLANAPTSSRERILARAIELGKTKDERRSAQHLAPKGRQTKQGQITDSVIKQAIKDLTGSMETD